MNDTVKSLQGTWNITALEMDGGKLPAGAFTGAKMVIEGTQFVAIGMGATYRGNFTVNTAVTPAQLDMNFTDGPEKGRASLGIFKLDGDTWTVCLTVTSQTRPTGLATSPKSGHALETFVRASEGGEEASGSSTDFGALEFASRPELEGEWAMVSCVRDGMPLDKRMVQSGRRTYRGFETTVTFGGQLFLKAKVKVDDSTTPHKIDYYITDGGHAGQIQRGLYEFTSGIFRTIYAGPGSDRPADFSTSAGDGRTLAEWKKIAQ